MDTTITTAAVDHDSDATISAVHPDIFESHILARLDGPSLASLACVSSQLHAFSTEEHLWRNICSSTWPSINHPRVQQIISAFSSGHRSFFSDSFPFPVPRPSIPDGVTLPTELIFAVDVYYQNQIIYSKVEELDTTSSWFLSSPFRAELLDPKDSAWTPVKYIGGGQDDKTWLNHMEENLSLSWIVIDPTRNKAVNISSRKAVSVQRHWLTGDVQVRFGTLIIGDERRGSCRELVECGVVITCCGKGGGEMHVSEMSMVMEDMDGRSLNGEDSLVILKGVMDSKRRKQRNGNEGKIKYVEFEERRRERKEETQRKERLFDLVFVTFGVAGLFTFWSAILFK